jgi:dephospho-CoA kinase
VSGDPGPAATEPRRGIVRIGITGPIGCGKSQVVRWLAELGAVVIDADEVAKGVTAPGQPAHDLVLRRFGAAVTAPDGTLDRAALGRIVFADPARLRELEAIVHPAVRPRILDALDAAERAGAPAVALEAIKLVEGGLAALCDEVWLVTCDADAQRDRLGMRGIAAADAEQRIAAQGGLADRLRPMANRVIDTSGSMADTRAGVAAAMAEALAAVQ